MLRPIFINPILVAKGLAKDNAFEPYLTTDYQQYKNTLYEYDDEKNYYPEVLPGSSVIVNSDIIMPNASVEDKLIVGGVAEERDDIEFVLGKQTTLEDQARLINMLVGKKTCNFFSKFCRFYKTVKNSLIVDDFT